MGFQFLEMAAKYSKNLESFELNHFPSYLKRNLHADAIKLTGNLVLELLLGNTKLTKLNLDLSVSRAAGNAIFKYSENLQEFNFTYDRWTFDHTE